MGCNCFQEGKKKQKILSKITNEPKKEKEITNTDDNQNRGEKSKETDVNQNLEEKSKEINNNQKLKENDKETDKNTNYDNNNNEENNKEPIKTNDIDKKEEEIKTNEKKDENKENINLKKNKEELKKSYDEIQNKIDTIINERQVYCNEIQSYMSKIDTEFIENTQLNPNGINSEDNSMLLYYQQTVNNQPNIEQEPEGLYTNGYDEKCYIKNDYDLYEINFEFKCKITNGKKRITDKLGSILLAKDKIIEMLEFKIDDEPINNYKIEDSKLVIFLYKIAKII